MEETLQTYVLPHWPFVIMSLSLGAIGQVFKKHIWTFERAKRKQGIYKFMYTTMGLHAPMLGAVLGLLGAPVSPGISGWAGRMLYHFGAGASAAWTVAAFKHFMRSRGIIVAESVAPPTPSYVPAEPGPALIRSDGQRVSLMPDSPVAPAKVTFEDEPGP